MKKKTSSAKNNVSKIIKQSQFEEPETLYSSQRQINITKDFTFSEFKKIADKVDLTQKEWSDVLHISERTLQRYSKDNSTFNFSLIDRILLIDKVLRKGITVFGSAKNFLIWLKAEPLSIEGKLGFGSLASFDGTAKILNQLGRIEHGILA
ncbi:MAG: antitoxin Xre-like helix-turn-helix domain-containing protein [Ginsengibacter sp.]